MVMVKINVNDIELAYTFMQNYGYNVNQESNFL